MKTTRITRILELVGEFIPGVHELTLLLPAFFGLHSAARALGFDLDWGPEVIAVISVTLSFLLWIIFCSLVYNASHSRDEVTSEVLRSRDSVHPDPAQGESHSEEKHALPAGFP